MTDLHSTAALRIPRRGDPRLWPRAWRWGCGLVLALGALALHAALGGRPFDAGMLAAAPLATGPGLLPLMASALTIAAVLFGPLAAIVPALLLLPLLGATLGLAPGGLAWPAARGEAAEAAAIGLAGLVAAAGAEARHAALSRDEAARAGLLASERRLRALAGAGAMLLWRPGPARGGWAMEGSGWHRLTGRAEAAADGEDWLAAVHPQDQAFTRAAWLDALAGGDPAEAEFRLRTRAGAWRWMRARILPVPAEGQARPLEWIGLVEDTDARRRAEERRALIAREMDHRAKNALAVVQAVIRLTRAEEPQAYAEAVEGRITALARAHALLTQGEWRGADLRLLAAQEMAAYGGLGDRIALEGPRLDLTPAAAQAMSLVLHELATNTAKYGALSAAGGRVRLGWEVEEGRLRLCWEELGGPRVTGPPARRGFGSRLIEASIRDQLGGRVVQEWRGPGLLVRIEAPLARVLAEG